MKVTQANILNQYALEQLNRENKKTNMGKEGEIPAAQDAYLANNANLEAGFTYNAQITMNASAVEQLMNQGEEIRDSVKDLVRDLLERQGYTLDQLKSGEIREIKVDEMAREKARKLIGPGGELSPEKVSDRIVNFAITAFGGDKNKIDIIKSSIDKGFAEAEHLLGQLADVSKTTYDMIQEKLDQWTKGNESAEVKPGDN